MPSRKTFLEALLALRDHEEVAEHGWVLLGMLRPDHHKAVESAAREGLVELADRETRAELSVYEGGPVVWAARLTGHGRDALVYTEDALDRRPLGLAHGERLVELRRSEMDAVRLYVYLDARLCVPPADGLEEKVRTARQLGNRWVVYLNEEQVASVAYAFYLRSVGGSGAEANRFARAYGVAFRTDGATGNVRL
ncbi:DUF6417 family protein [Streptomyces sp. NPDC001153]